MRALSIDYSQRKLLERDVPEPVLQDDDEVLFRVVEVGICGTDRELAAFEFGYGPEGDHFLIPGHEATGEVLRTGRGASHLLPGDFVVPSIRRACTPPCSSCAKGRRDLCLTGRYTERGIAGAHGYYTELAADRADDLVRIPANLAERAVLIEPLSVVQKAISRAFALHSGEPRRACVLGAGTIGLLAAAILALRGLEVDIISTEPESSRRATLAKSLGAGYNPHHPEGADIVIEAAGVPAAADSAFRLLAPLGVLMVLGARKTAESIPLLDLIIGNKVIAGSVNASPGAFEDAVSDLNLLSQKPLDRLIERTGFCDYRRTMLEPPGSAPKIVHVVS